MGLGDGGLLSRLFGSGDRGPGESGPGLELSEVGVRLCEGLSAKLCSSSSNWPMKLRFGEMMGLAAFTCW